MRGRLLTGVIVALIAFVVAGVSVAKDRPFSTAELIAMKWGPAPEERDIGTGGGNTSGGGQFSKAAIERFRCTSAGNPSAAVDISCNTTQYSQDWNPDNEIAVAVDPADPTTCWRDRTTTSTASTTRLGLGRRSSRQASLPRSMGARPGSMVRFRCGAATAPAIRRRRSIGGTTCADGAAREHRRSGRGVRFAG